MSEPATIAELFGGSYLDPIADPYPVYARLRRERPVCPMFGMTGEAGFLLTRYVDVREALKNAEVFSNRANARGMRLVFGRTIIEMDGAEHLLHRNLITPSLAPRALRGDFPKFVEAIAHGIIDEFVELGEVDLVRGFTFNYPIQVFTQILGLPPGKEARFHELSIDVVHIADDPSRALAASAELAELLGPVVEERRRERTRDLISHLTHAEVEGRGLTDEEVISFLRLLVSAGSETTYHLIGSALFGLLHHPDQLEEVRADRALVRPALDEALRWEAPVQIIPREVLETSIVGGVEIPEGSHVTLSIASANHDETKFEDPERFDIHRSPNEHLTFGLGRHFCAGSRLAYLEAEIALNALLDRLPGLRIDPAQECGVVGFAFRSPNRLPVLFDAKPELSPRESAQ